MNNIENRIEKLESVTGIKNTEPVTSVVVDNAKGNFGELEEAEYRKDNPDFSGVLNVISVANEQSKQLTERIIAGERT